MKKNRYMPLTHELCEQAALEAFNDKWFRRNYLAMAEKYGGVTRAELQTAARVADKRARRQYMRAGADLKRSHFIPLYRSYRLISYNGYFKGTKSRAAAEALNQQKLFKSAKWAVRAAAIKERSLAV